MTTQPASLLINLDSRRARSAYSELVEACCGVGIEITKLYKIGKSSTLPATVGVIKRAAPKLLIIASGDGTISRAMSILAGTDIEVGIVPLGTTNNFARSLRLPLNIPDAVKTIATSQSHKVDLGRVDDRYFANVVGIGLSALVARRVTDRQKRRFGRLAYALTGLRCLARHKPFFVTVTDKDGELALNLETHQVVVANGRYHAGKEIAANLGVDNGELVVFPIGGRSRFSYIAWMIDFYIGSPRKVQHASYLIARNVKILTDRLQPSEIDGEVYGPTPLTFQVMNKMVSVRYKGEA